MRILVTGGTGVVGQSAVQALLDRGHEVRLLSRHATDDARAWPHRVEPHDGDIGNATEVWGSADDCDAVLHLAAIVNETPPKATFQRINVDGTRHIVEEAIRAGVPRLVHVSSLGCDRGESEYHVSKRKAEAIAETFTGNWTIVRPGNVYGPGDEQVSLVLKMVRSLPAVPVIDGGDQEFQPIWTDDLAAVLAEAVERSDLAGRTLEVAGPDVVTAKELVDRVAALTDREPVKVPIPTQVASFGIRLAEFVGIDVPLNRGQLTMLDEGNVVRAPEGNALGTVFAVRPTPLDEGLRKLADALPEQLPEQGVGNMTRKRFWADIESSRLGPEALLERFRSTFSESTPDTVDVDAEPDTPSEPRLGETLTIALPMRGNVQVRVEELAARRMTFVTLEGHPIAGAVRFMSEQRGDQVRFEVQVYEKAANVADWVAMTSVGGRLQDATWRDTVKRATKLSGGTAPAGVQSEASKLDDDQARLVDEWLDGLVKDRERGERESRSTSRRGGDDAPMADVAADVASAGSAREEKPRVARRDEGGESRAP